MKVLQVVTTMNPKSGGPPEVVLQNTRLLKLDNNEVDIVSLDEPNAPYILASPEPIIAVGQGKGRWQYSKSLYQWLMVNGHNYDFVILNSVWTYPAIATYFAHRKIGFPYLVFPHGALDSRININRLLAPWYKRLCWLLYQRKILANASDLLFTSSLEKQHSLNAYFPRLNKGSVVQIGIEPPPKLNAKALTIWKERFRGKRVILFLARLHPKKGCDLLIRAFAKTFKEDSNWLLAIGGNDQVNWKSELVKMSKELNIEDRILWLDHIDRQEKWNLIRSVEAFVLPSHQENFGVGVAEALSCSVPVLITDKVDIHEFVVREQCGFVETDTEEGVAKLLSRWAHSTPKEIEGMRKAALRCFNKHLILKNIFEFWIGDGLHAKSINR